MGLIEEIQNWYERQCDGEWEHHNGVSIESLDNPGWHLTVNLTGTKLAKDSFEVVSSNVPQDFIDQSMGKVAPPYLAASPTADDWFLCFVKNEKFEGSGSPHNLSAILKIFLNWAK